MAFTRKKLSNFSPNLTTNITIEPDTTILAEKLYNIFEETLNAVQVEVSRISKNTIEKSNEKLLSKYELALFEDGYTPAQISEMIELARHSFK